MGVDRSQHTVAYPLGGPTVCYFAYGLNIRSAVPLPELAVREATPDITIRLGRVECPTLGHDGGEARAYRSDDEEYIFQSPAGAVLFRGGREIIVDATPGLEDRFLRLFILGPALSCVLLQRGL